MNKNKIHEIVFNPFTQQWVIIAGHRVHRPWRPEESGRQCPFCPGSEETKKLGAWDVLVLPNRFPALTQYPSKISRIDFVNVRKAFGVCDVVVETPAHEGDLCNINLDHMKKIIDVFSQEYITLGSLNHIRYVAIFRNKGKEIGVSLTHPHSQIYALPFVPLKIRLELESFRKYFRRKRSCLLCDLMKMEKKNNRIIYKNAYFVALLPYFAMWPYEIHIYPIRHVQALSDLTDEEKLYLADILRVTTGIYNTLFDRDLPYIMVFHVKPTDYKDYSYYHMHVEFYEPYNDRDKLKYAAGIEWGFGVFTYDGIPEERINELRKACKKALSNLDKYLGTCYH
ncbi:MAG: galactose-1-phosphate uridylyltransferase [Thermoprotei archaeon]